MIDEPGIDPWKDILKVIDTIYGFTENFEKLMFVEFEDAEQIQRNYLIIQSTPQKCVATDFSSFIIYDRINETAKVYEMDYLFDILSNKTTSSYIHHIKLTSVAPYIHMYFSLTLNNSDVLNTNGVLKYYPENFTISGVSGDVLTASMTLPGEITSVKFIKENDIEKFQIKYINENGKSATIINDVIQFSCQDTVIEL